MACARAQFAATTATTTTTADAGKTSGGPRHWLMKAEPDSRLEKGVDVAFSIDHFERAKDQTTSWDGVRNPEARSMMRDRMRIGDKVLFYHSNCKLPGVAGLATIVRQGYPDHTAWDPKHPYFDPKTDKESPKWFMVDVKLDRRLPNLVPLALLQHLAAAKAAEQDLEYLDKQDIEAISKMQLLNRGRLSVQSVEQRAYEAILRLGDKGGWTDWPGKWNPKGKTKEVKKRPSDSKDEDQKGPSKGAKAEKDKEADGSRRSKRAKR
ncbi:DUF55-domain-containing protein [Acaromyces ingoldii]|uniref:DUF55-domain-containing protein n=1 Tax=Acaromyces ingoldii TaxID=215250 RepID=A0A316YM73_9BASI|nr:DUF55-domain-containing protein [Acaromyces ingoldii]PWN90477.1 DUF55-domain-containing protein [Acaromyces ingoldii]